MMNRNNSQSERRVRPALNLDMISSLPKDIKDKILMCLPLRDAIRTSLLSRTWRHAWASMPALQFIDESILSTDLNAKFLSFVDRVLLLHNGPIWMFCLETNWCCEAAIDRWMLVLSRNGIQVLVLDSGYNDERYKVPSTLFFCQELKHVELSNCIVEPPQMFKGFSLLHTLKLSKTTLTDKGLENLVSSCPFLENLWLANFNGCTHLKIHAPKLQALWINGFFEDLHLGTPNLVVANIALDGKPDQYVAGGTKSNLIQALGSIPVIEELEIYTYFMEYLAVGSLPRKLPTTFDCLWKLSLEINLGVREETMAALCLFQNAPNLEELELWPVPEETPIIPVGKFWKLNMDQRFSFKHLRYVCLNTFWDLEAHFEFVQFVLSTAPKLQRMTLKDVDCPDESKVLRLLLQFPRASKQAEVICT